MKKIFTILTLSILLISCEKDALRVETPYVCSIASTGIEADVLVNGEKEKIDSIVQREVNGENKLVYYYSFRICEGDELKASIKGNNNNVSFNQLNNVGIGIGYFEFDNPNNWTQLYCVLITDYDVDGDSECYSFDCPFTDSNGDGIYDGFGQFIGQDLDGDGYGDFGNIPTYEHKF